MGESNTGSKQPLSTWDYFSRALTILEILSIIAGLYFIWFQLKNVTDNQKSDRDLKEIQFLIDFKQDFSTGINNQIYLSLVHHEPILVENGGKFTVDELKDYLSLFNELGFVTEKNFIDGGVIWSFFYYYITYTFENKEISAYLKESRKYAPGRFGWLDDLYNYLQMYSPYSASTTSN